jgi:hypothetical protein
MAIGAGYKALGKARRSMINREKKTNMWENIISDVGSAGIFAAGKIQQAKTAWKEYETGYEALGGDKADIPKRGSFWKRAGQTLMPGGDKGFFQKPEGDVRIGAAIYDRGQIQKAGSFLGSDAAAILSPEQRQQYLGRTVPGRDMTTEEVTGVQKSLRPDRPYVESEYDVDEEFGPLTTDSPVYQPAPPESIKPMILQGQEPGLTTFGTDWETPQGGSYGRWKADQSALGTTVPLPQDKSGINIAFRRQQYFQRLGEGDKIMEETGSYARPKDRNAYNVWNKRYNQ